VPPAMVIDNYAESKPGLMGTIFFADCGFNAKYYSYSLALFAENTVPQRSFVS